MAMVQALARAGLCASRSTARSGMVSRKVAPMVPSTSLISPPWARTSSPAMTRPRPVPPRARRGLERLEQMLPRLGREARAGVGDLDHDDGALAPPGDAHLVARRIVRRARLQRLHGVARQIEDDAQQLVGVGVDDQSALDRGDPADAACPRAAACRAPPRRSARARPACGPAAAPGRGRRTASIRRTRWRVRARASAWARSAARAGPAGCASPSENSCAEVSRLRRS